MQTKATKLELWAVSVTVVILILTILIPRDRIRQERSFDGSGLTAIIDLGAFADTSKELLTGYNYYLLEQFAKDHNEEIIISLAQEYEASIDSLKRRHADIIVLPFVDSLVRDSMLTSIPVDSLSVWLMNDDCRKMMDELNGWIDAYHNSESFEKTRNMFLKVYSPYRSRRREVICPYDSLIRVHAEDLGWDWRMLAAVIYQESRFHIEARSKRGATGLMQMIPATAERFGAHDTLDPDENIEAGARYLKYLWKRFGKYGDNKSEKYKYTLAAYNAGEGRIEDCINYAQYLGVSTSYWDNVVKIIPEMSDSATVALDCIKRGPFKGQETIRYVDSVIELYKNFCRICPE